MNEYLFSFLSGLLQGFTEFLPVSSSGHLALLHNIFGFSEPHLAFDILLHSGTAAAVAIVYKDAVKRLFASALSVIKKLFTGGFSYKACDGEEKLCVMILVSTLPLAAGIFISGGVSALAASNRAVGILLMINAAVLTAGCAAKRRAGEKTIVSAGIKSALIIGILQLFAAAPGISRSGVTIAGGLIAGLSGEDAVKYSFLLSLPATVGANIVNIKDLAGAGSAPGLIPCVIGTLTATLAGLCAIKLIKRISKKTNFGIFAVYCFAAGAAAYLHG